MSKRKTFEEMSELIKKYGIKPGFTKKWYDDNYKNFNSKLPLICSCGNSFEVLAGTLKVETKKECKDCRKQSIIKRYKLEYQELVDAIESLQCKPDFKKRWYNSNFKGQDTELPLICSCQKPFTRTYRELKQRPSCDTCRIENKKSKRLSYKEITEVILKKGVKAGFNEEWFNQNYSNSKNLLPVVCRCGESFEIQYKNLYNKDEVKCVTCRAKGMNPHSQKKFARLKAIAEKQGATLTESLKTKNIELQTPITFTCKCGKEETVEYKKITQDGLVCARCNAITRKKERKLEALRRKEALLLGDLGFDEHDFY